LQWVVSVYLKTRDEAMIKICLYKFKQESGFIVIVMMFIKITFDNILTPGVRDMV